MTGDAASRIPSNSDEQPVPGRAALGDVEIAYAEWRPHLKGRGPTLLFVHGTSFHGRVWDEVAAALPRWHAIAVDQRGHGRSTGEPVSHWRVFGEDLAGLVRALDLRDVVGVAHSMGGHSMIAGGAAVQDRFRQMILIDPMVAPPAEYAGGRSSFLKPSETHPAAKRKRRFASPEEMIERFRDRVPYSLFTPDTLDAYCRHGLLPAADGDGWELACAPEMEASVYMASRTNGAIFDSIRALQTPVLVVRAVHRPREGVTDFTGSPTWPALAGQFADGRDLYRPERTHFLPMEAPAEVAELVTRELEATGE
ncbi:MAG: alpha/beta fold hydrolase [Alphaproteobacteria bacterium]|nr:alpha/beta fold hydrolase [Alphaproteobacteria bacterium]